MKIDESSLYRTADFGTICAAYCLGFEIDSLERDPRSSERVVAIFKRSPELDDMLKLLFTRQLRIEPLAFLETTRTVKARLRDAN